MFKDGDYDLDHEERLLKELLKKIGNADIEEIEKLTRYLGLIGAFRKQNELDPNLLLLREQTRMQAATIARENAKYAAHPSNYVDKELKSTY